MMEPVPTRRDNQPKKIKVKITKNHATNHWNVVSNHPVPTVQVIFAELDTKQKAKISGSYFNGMNLDQLLNIGLLRTSEVAAAITKATAILLSRQRDIEHERIVVEGGRGFLALGNAIFEINAIDYSPTARALPVLRRNVEEQATIEAKSIITAAQEEAADLRNKSNIELSKTNAEVIQLRNERQALNSQISRYIPEWALVYGINFKSQGSVNNCMLSFGLWIQLKITSIVFNNAGVVYTIKALQAPAIPVLLWCAYAPFSIRDISVGTDMHPTKYRLPHITDRTCAVIGDAPPDVTCIAHYNTLKSCIERNMAVINLSSLLSQFDTWDTRLHAFIPPKVLEVFKNYPLENSSYPRALIALYQAGEIPCVAMPTAITQPINFSTSDDDVAMTDARVATEHYDQPAIE